jgi:hypothetical protein
MARQKGIVKLKGTLDDITFYKSKDGFIAKLKSGIPAETIRTSPNFVRTRENMSEFSTAAKEGKLLRTALHAYMVNAKDGRVTSRLTKLMSQILKLDATSVRGLRTVGVAISLPNAMLMLQGFNFNIKSTMSAVLLVPYSVNTSTGVITINNLLPANDIVAPEGATHFSLQGVWGKVDFTNKVYNVQSSPVVNTALTAAASTITLTPTAAPTGTGTNVYLLLIQFFQMVNTVQYSLRNGAFNSLAIVQVA